MQLFDGILTTFETLVLKPYPKTFQLLLDHYKLKPTECFFIDNLEKNIRAAQQLGIDGTVYISYNALQVELKSRKIL